MITVDSLSRDIIPGRTILFLGAGASIPSGAPSAKGLVVDLCKALEVSDIRSDDLMEAASLLELRVGRHRLVSAIRDRLKDVEPTQGLLVLPTLKWAAVYSTNWDCLVEKAYERCGEKLVVVRSNFDYLDLDRVDGTILFKLHGSLEQDRVDGSKLGFVLTESDYDEYERFRQLVYRRLSLDLATHDVLILGHSLRDRHLRDNIKQAISLRRQALGTGRIYVLVVQVDRERALLLGQMGATVAFGSIDEVAHALAERTDAHPISADQRDELLPVSLRASTWDVSHARRLTAKPERLFSGSPAGYADVAQGFTFARSREPELLSHLREGLPLLAIVGVAGVGKTTLARRICDRLSIERLLCYEHNPDFPLRADKWVQVGRHLAERGLRGVLLLDDCVDNMFEMNQLIDGLWNFPAPSSLQIVCTAQRSRWEPPSKSPRLFERGEVVNLEGLDSSEVENLLDLAVGVDTFRERLEPRFLMKSRAKRINTIRHRCGSDMFVALKYLFASESLDEIILREYKELSIELRDIYRTVAVLEAAGAKVHRQLVVRLLGIEVERLVTILRVLEGLVFEFDIAARDGLFGWRTRHQVIASVVTSYKMEDEKSLYDLLRNVIENASPMVHVERQTLNQLCFAEYGIARLSSLERRIELLELIVKTAPLERVPRHRLVRELINSGRLRAAKERIRESAEVVGPDSALFRYSVLLEVARAKGAKSLLPEDRRAILRRAWRQALEGVRRYGENKYQYITLRAVSLAWYDQGGGLELIDEALPVVRRGVEITHDPALGRFLRDFDSERERIASGQHRSRSGWQEGEGSANGATERSGGRLGSEQ